MMHHQGALPLVFERSGVEFPPEHSSRGPLGVFSDEEGSVWTSPCTTVIGLHRLLRRA